MTLLLPDKCPITNLCGQRWHWSKESREDCRRRQEWKHERDRRIAANPYRYGSFEFTQHERLLEERRQATAAHAPVTPTDPQQTILVRNGERQLSALNDNDLKIIGLLMTSDIYRINHQMRTYGKLKGSAGGMVSYAGYDSMENFVDDAQNILISLGDSLTLDEPVRTFRGIGLPADPDESFPDVAGLSGHLNVGTPWHEKLTDPGFSFATTSSEDALYYDGSGRGEYPLRQPAIIELKAHRALCAHAAEYRSQNLFARTYSIDFLHTATSQLIFAPGTEWSITSVHRDSEFSVPLITMEQQ
ncbi:hypothetical protein ANMWB30_23390 [Arthrobacter sp. MWB30]|nr:hypothetical protein ANMWB30_23390 [Arthrobacter sp. MWB30]